MLRTSLILIPWLFSCSNASFESEQTPSNPSPATQSDTAKSGGNQASEGGSTLQNPPSEEGQDPSDSAAIGRCLAKFGGHPFGAQQAYNFRKISASVQVFGVGNAIVDQVPTSEPQLILISAAVNVLGQATYQLLNPNGWYCLKVDVNVLAKTNINLHCKANLADSKVDVNVGSSSQQPVGQVGVHVGSDVNVTPTGC